MRLTGPLLAALLGGAACSAGLPSPGVAEVSAVQAHDPTARVENLEHGRTLYQAKCSGCHMLIDPAQFSADAWPEKVERMLGEKRVRLATDETRDLVRYLVGASAVARL